MVCVPCADHSEPVFLLSGDGSRCKSPETLLKEMRPVPVKQVAQCLFQPRAATIPSTLVSYWPVAVGSVDSSCFLTQDGSAAALWASCRSPLSSQNFSAATDCPRSAVQTQPPHQHCFISVERAWHIIMKLNFFHEALSFSSSLPTDAVASVRVCAADKLTMRAPYGA